MDGLDSGDFVQSTQLLHATVNTAGDLQFGNAVGATNTSDGRYTVEFGRNLNNCSATVTTGSTSVTEGNFAVTSAVVLINNEASIFMAYWPTADTTFNSSFHLLVMCPVEEADAVSSSTGANVDGTELRP